MDAIAGPFEIDWAARGPRVACGARSSSATTPRSTRSRRIEALLELRAEHGLTGADVERIELDTFQVAYDIIGGGEEGDKKQHRLQGGGRPLAALPARRRAARRPGDARAVPARERIADRRRPAAAAARRRAPRPELSRRFPPSTALALRLHLRDGRTLEARAVTTTTASTPGRWAGSAHGRSSTASPRDGRARNSRARDRRGGRATRRARDARPDRVLARAGTHATTERSTTMTRHRAETGRRASSPSRSCASNERPPKPRNARRDRDPRALLHADGAALPEDCSRRWASTSTRSSSPAARSR